MAIFHLSIKTVSRSDGRSATAAAAYRAGCEIADDRTGQVHDYRRKSGVVHTEIVRPAGAPAWDRSTLWNEAERSEKRKNSVVAREWELALPAELDAGQQKDVALHYAQWLAKRFGVIADVAIHAPNRHGDQRNHHAHILTTTRSVGQEGIGAKTRELDDKKSGAVEEARAQWATLVNQALEIARQAARVDHRSHARRGIEEAPTIHLGPSATAMERRGQPSERGHINKLLSLANEALRAAKKYLADLFRPQQKKLDLSPPVAADRPLTRNEAIMESMAKRDTEKLKVELQRRNARKILLERQARTRQQEQLKKQQQQQQQQKPRGRNRGPGLGF